LAEFSEGNKNALLFRRVILLPVLKRKELIKYLSSIYKKPIELKYLGKLSGKGDEELKGFGYGEPILIEFEVDGQKKKAVLETMRPGGFGHDHYSDRAQCILWQYATFNKLPKHAPSVDAGAFTKEGMIISLGGAEEFFLLTEHIQGVEYYKDLEKIQKKGKLSKLDRQRAEVLSDYLVQIHALRREAPELYLRRTRELLGHGECIMGLLDSYPPQLDFTSYKELESIEKKCLEWRWKIKNKTHRLCQVHGDFHPWNVLFRQGTDFSILDRSRGEWGEGADDLSAMAINYLFFSLQTYGELAGPFLELWRLFFDHYLAKTKDYEILKVIQPFFAWRGLVIASPVWYPSLAYETRRKIFNFINNVLETETFEFEKVNSYL